MYEEYLEYVEKYLIEHNGLYPQNEHQCFRSRIEHTKRVISWIDIISEGMEIDREALYLAAVFHDIGYDDQDRSEHGKRGAGIFRAFAKENGFDEKLTDKVAYMIEVHSEKSRLQTDKLPLELTLLMEADQMDEEGTMRIMWDCLVCGKIGARSYNDAYERMEEFRGKMPNNMVTPIAKAIWERKKRLYEEFMEQLKNDLFIDKENNTYRKKEK